MKRVLGVDPGNTGALCLLEGKTIRIVDMPTIKIQKNKRNLVQVDAYLLTNSLKRLGRIDHAWIEKVGSMPGQGVASMFAFGRGVGVIEGVIAALGIPVSFVPPQTWQKVLRVKGKDASREKCMKLFPRDADDFKRKMDNGRSDATLIAKYGRRILLQDV